MYLITLYLLYCIFNIILLYITKHFYLKTKMRRIVYEYSYSL